MTAVAPLKLLRASRKMKSVSERFWRRVNKDGPIHPTLGTACWLWTASANKQGYGFFTVAGRSCRAHRSSWTLAVGPIPAGLQVLHKCDNPICVNPDHLFLGTQADNIRDAQSKGRLRFRAAPKKTHCLRGHAFDPANTRIDSRGKQCCRKCACIHAKTHYYLVRVA